MFYKTGEMSFKCLIFESIVKRQYCEVTQSKVHGGALCKNS